MDDLKDAILEAQAEATDAFREVMLEFILPMVEQQARQMWITMPDDMKEKFKTERPQEYAALMKGLKRETPKGNTGNRNSYDRAGSNYQPKGEQNG